MKPLNCMWLLVGVTMLSYQKKHHLKPFFLIRTDKYDGKPIYWVEEEVEVEWQKTTSRTQAKSSEYQVAASLGDAMADANEPLHLDMKAIASGLLQ